ncbi:MAG: hypothetical protein J0H49_13580 [Acidobacteria bacterium]|nr:hypothetical protein [Acidobacteriota bacterium]
MRTTQSSLLRLFAINDQGFPGKAGEEGPPLRTNLVEIVKVDDGKRQDKTLPRLAQWLQHVQILGSQPERLSFDLMFIDIKFDEDPWAPPYGEENGNPDEKVNPLGLLHALTFAAKQDPWGPPFVWGYHSGDPKSVKDDPIAIIVFSLLSALEQRVEANVMGSPWKWDDVGLHKTPGYAVTHFSNAIQCLPKGGPEVVFKDIMVRYRQKLLEHVEDERTRVGAEGLENALRLVAAPTNDNRQALTRACIQLSNSRGTPWKRDLLLQSLFADQLTDRRDDFWPSESLACLRVFLEALQEASRVEKVTSLVAQVDAIMQRVANYHPTVLKGLPRDRQKRIGAMAIVCWWLQQKYLETVPDGETPHFNTHSLLADFGYVPAGEKADEAQGKKVKKGSRFSNRRAVDGCLQPLGFRGLREFFDHLETTDDPLPSPYREVGQYWWVNRLRANANSAPRCVR